jgi:hypothetical protein
MHYQKPGSRVLIGNAMIPEHFVSGVYNYAATLCFSICSDPDIKDYEERHRFFDISLTLRQLYDLRQSLTDYLYPRLTYPLTSDRPFFETLSPRNDFFNTLYQQQDGSNMKAQIIYIDPSLHSTVSRPCIRLHQISRML